ncbi:MAG TPA: HAMP domain-containing sensor histidine kinase [Vicinamibacteria bacterium]
MRLGVKFSLLLLAIYGALVAVFAWGLDRWLRTFDAVLTRETVALLAREKGAEVSERMFEALQMTDDIAQQRLRERIEDTVSLSELLTSLSVVDAAGRVVASDHLPAGLQLPPPQELFAAGRTVRAEPLTPRPLFTGGEYVVYLPAESGGRLLGYLRLTFDRSGVKDLYGEARRRLVALAVVGLAGVAALGVLLQVRLTRRAAALARALDAEGADAGPAPAPLRAHDEFARALAAAARMRQALSAARQESSRLHHGFDALAQVARVGVLQLGDPAHVDFANERARELLDAADTPALQARWDELAPALAPILQSNGTEGDGGRALTIEVEAPSGPRPLRFEAYRLGGDGCDEHLVLVTDPSLLDTLEVDVRLASQLEGLARGYRTAAHELRAPLAAMMVNLDLLQDGVGSERQGHYVGVLREELVRLNRALAAMLDQTITRNEARQRFDLRSLLDELQALMAPQARRQRVAVHLALPALEVPLVGARDRLKQALLNVAVNALEAMPQGGEMRMEVRVEQGQARVAISDTGRGIPAELLERIYESDFTTKGGGSGIGLYVARTLVRWHGGTIQAHSSEGRGTRVEVTLPLVPRS